MKVGPLLQARFVILMGWWMDPGLAATLFRVRVRGYLLLEWLCFITVRSETRASIINNKIFIFYFYFLWLLVVSPFYQSSDTGIR